MLFLVSLVALGVIAVLGWNLYRRVGASRIDAIANKRRASSRTVSSGEFVDGNRHLKVALALTSTDLYYENADMKAYLDLRWVQEVEYDTCLATGHEIADGKVLRIRCYSQVFEFVLPSKVVPTWYLMLPPRRAVEMPPVIAPVVAAAAV
ncbi:MAG TPA: hypothetical protein VGR95_08620 [Thermoanaerobaculia bacterium]|jgi:hypothetical protein|nr:hypothetical protein [Thermoanaerobaculia bacterium]